MAKPFSVGSTATDRDGTPVKVARSFHAPYWVCSDGIIVADYGHDEIAAEAHFMRLASGRRDGSPVRMDGRRGNALGVDRG